MGLLKVKGWFFIGACAFISSLFFPKTASQKPLFKVDKNHPFVVIIPSYNNSNFVEKNLTSVFEQNYAPFRVIYIDDHSSDDTLAKAKDCIARFGAEGKTTLISNPNNRGSLANIYSAIHTCKEEEIVVLLDGDDFLAHEGVLARVNQSYANKDIWLTYGNYLDYPSYVQNPTIVKPLAPKTIKNKTLRKRPWVTSHLRTFYVSLFKQIKLEDLFYRGRFYSMAGDLALMFPLLELAGSHIDFISDTLYLYNRSNPISDHKINFAFQEECARAIRSKSPYPALKELTKETSSSPQADLFIFSSDHPLHLHALLESTKLYVKGLRHIYVFYESSTTRFARSYETLKDHFSNVHFFSSDQAFESLCKKWMFEDKNDSAYLLLAKDTLLIKDTLDIQKSIQDLKQTQAYGVYFTYHPHLDYSSTFHRYQNIPPHEKLFFSHEATPYAWAFSEGADDFACSHSFDLVLYRKEDLYTTFEKMHFQSIKELEKEWREKAPLKRIGLFYPLSKAVHLLSSTSSLEENERFLYYFEKGLRLDPPAYFQISCPSQVLDRSLFE